MVRQRSEIDEKYKWDLSSVYQNDSEAEEDLDEVSQKIQELVEYREGFGNAEELVEFLQEYEEAGVVLQRVSKYASMRHDEDMRDEEAQMLKQRVESLGSEFSRKTDFFNIRLQQVGKNTVEEWIEEKSFLKKREHYLKSVLRLEDHTLSMEMEETLSDLSEVLGAPSESYSMLWNADLEFPVLEVNGENLELTPTKFTTVLRRPEKEIRDQAHKQFYDFIGNYSNTISTNLSKSLKKNWKIAKTRNYSTTREASLYPDELPVEIYDKLVKTASSNTEVLSDHLELKRKTWGIDEVKPQDIYLPSTTTEEPEIPFEQAKQLIVNALKPLGEEYQSIIRTAFEERWVDVFESKGKRSGAYSGGAYDTRPFILMNYEEDINSLYTLAHELGHSVHSYLSTGEQPYLEAGYPIFLAEIASTVNETLLTEHLRNHEDRGIREHALNQELENFRTTFFRQTMFADFEHRMYQKIENNEPLTYGTLNQMYRQVKSSYYTSMEMDDRISREWMRIPHFYYQYYVFQYATGISAANRFVDQIQDRGPEDYLDFLRLGGSRPPVQALEDSGIDIKSGAPMESLIKRYGNRLEQIRSDQS